MYLPPVDLVQHAVLICEVHDGRPTFVLGPHIGVPQVMVVVGLPVLPVAVEEACAGGLPHGSNPFWIGRPIPGVVRIIAVRVFAFLLDRALRYELHVAVLLGEIVARS